MIYLFRVTQLMLPLMVPLMISPSLPFSWFGLGVYLAYVFLCILGILRRTFAEQGT